MATSSTKLTRLLKKCVRLERERDAAGACEGTADENRVLGGAGEPNKRARGIADERLERLETWLRNAEKCWAPQNALSTTMMGGVVTSSVQASLLPASTATATLGHYNTPLETIGDALACNEFQLMERGLVSDFRDAREFLAFIASQVCPSITVTALDLRENHGRRFATGVRRADLALGGGFPCGQITELVGKAGSGKTQWCIAMCARAAVLERKPSIYLDSEGKFSAARAAEMVLALGGDLSCVGLIRVMRVESLTSRELSERIRGLEEAILSEGVGLVVLDSVAALARAESFDSLPERQAAVSKQAQALKSLAIRFGIPVLVTNQVSGGGGKGETGTSFKSVPETIPSALEERRLGVITPASLASNVLRPALGMVWFYCVNCRVVLDWWRESGEKTVTGEDKGLIESSAVTNDIRRVFKVVKSSMVVDACVEFVVYDGGVRDADARSPNDDADVSDIATRRESSAIPPVMKERAMVMGNDHTEEEEDDPRELAHYDGLSEELTFLNSLSRETLEAMGF